MLNWARIKGKLEGGTNSAFLALIPKVTNASIFTRFRPISLCNALYKFLTEIIAAHLKKILPRLISENQGGFLQNRYILDNVNLVQEAIHSSLESGVGYHHQFGHVKRL